MNQPAQVPPQQDVLVIYLTDSDSEDEPEEPEAPPAVGQPSWFLHRYQQLFSREEFWDTIEEEIEALHDPNAEPESEIPDQPPRPEHPLPGCSSLSDDTYAASEARNPYWIERPPKHHRYSNPHNAGQSSAEE
jgi:hypothetical protein